MNWPKSPCESKPAQRDLQLTLTISLLVFVGTDLYVGRGQVGMGDRSSMGVTELSCTHGVCTVGLVLLLEPHGADGGRGGFSWRHSCAVGNETVSLFFMQLYHAPLPQQPSVTEKLHLPSLQETKPHLSSPSRHRAALSPPMRPTCPPRSPGAPRGPKRLRLAAIPWRAWRAPR